LIAPKSKSPQCKLPNRGRPTLRSRPGLCWSNQSNGRANVGARNRLAEHEPGEIIGQIVTNTPQLKVVFRGAQTSRTVGPTKAVTQWRHLPSASPMHGTMRIGVLTLSIAGCAGADCIAPPCALPVAITVSVTSSAFVAGIPGAFVQATGFGSPLPCNEAPGATCIILGSLGTYELDIGAPGFQTVHRTVQVSGTTPTCGCSMPDAQHLDVVLSPAGASRLQSLGAPRVS
jgi:hypothetical protein